MSNQIQEVSNKLLKNYVKAATTDVDIADIEKPYASSADELEDIKKRQRKRLSGLRMATKKMSESTTDESTQEKEEKMSQSQNTLEEAETAAARTLTPESKPAEGMSKASMMANVMSAMNGAKKSDLIAFFQQTMDQFGPNKFPGQDSTNKSAHNMATIKAKASVKEDVEEMFGDDETISEEFKQKVETLFEAAVNAKLEIELARLEEKFDEAVQEATDEYMEGLVEKLNDYVTYGVNQWVEDNKVALEAGLKLEIFENFFGGLKKLFIENNVSIPTEEVSLVDELRNENLALRNRVNEELEKNIELSSINEDLLKNQIFGEAVEGLADSQIDKFRTLVEGINASSIEEYTRKINTIKETYFKNKPNKSAAINEEVMGIDNINAPTPEAPNPHTDTDVTEIAKLLSTRARISN